MCYMGKLPKRKSVTKVIEELHWLKVQSRCVYKILLIVYKRFYGACPSFLCNILEISDLERKELKYTHYKTKYGERAFRNSAPRLWNQLSLEMRTEESILTFKRKLKTYLFTHTGVIINGMYMYRQTHVH